MGTNRHLDWQGSYNVRDLGGLPTRDGRRTAWRAVVRGDEPNGLTDAGWAALCAYGIRTVVDLRDHTDQAAESQPPGPTTVRVPLDDHEDTEFWQRWGSGLDCTPLYYRAFLDRFPSRIARVFTAVAEAPTGGVLIHCGGGRDRTGLIVALLLALVDVPVEEIAADYALSASRLAPAWRDLDLGDQNGRVDAILHRHGTTATQAVGTALDGLDVREYLRGTGLTEPMLRAIGVRLLGE
ncbi:MAG: tyrosine-protein phosphatase [Actinophytocola sp.]|uniref:tyrosine-protein phosphatase n=1 Tax=Actinophytocola sp. TaxID=1872138 RepID=UPI003D6AC0ED